MKMNDQRVRALPHPDQGQCDYADDAVASLAVRVGTTAKTFRLVIGSGQEGKPFTLGKYDPPRFTLAMAREKARDIIARDRLEQTQLPRTTFKEASELYDRLHLPALRPTTARDIRRTLNREFAKLANMALTDITRRDIAPIL